MDSTAGSRELIAIEDQGAIVRGTYHKTPDDMAGRPPLGRTGVLFLNSLSPTRAGTGDSAVYWASELANGGYPVFRVDLPGFGDTDLDPPPDLLSHINHGGYAASSAAIAKQLTDRFNLGGMVLVGLCAGAVTALYSAGISKECVGLVLLDPYFHLPLKDPSKIWQKLTGRFSRSRPGQKIGETYDSVKGLFHGNRPPSNANLNLLKRWKEVTSSSLPVLVFRAHSGFKPKGEVFDYFAHILGLSGPRSRVTFKMIEGCGHTFSNQIGKTAVHQQTIHWMTSYFPLLSGEAAVLGEKTKPHPEDQSTFKTQEHCLPV